MPRLALATLCLLHCALLAVAQPPATLPEPDLGPSVAPQPSTPVVPPLTPPPAAKTPDTAADAAAAFKAGEFAEADRLFASLGGAKLNEKQKAAWAYCRIKLAGDRLNTPNCDAATAAALVQDLTDALQLIPNNVELRDVGQRVLKAAQAKAGNAKPPAVVQPVAGTGDTVESGSFRVHHGGDRTLGDAVLKAAEAARTRIFERWSGPPAGAWQPKCDIVIHASADAYARATRQPAALTGHATVSLTDGRVTARRIDLRSDDRVMIENALPRELTHVILADLFPNRPPPKWAEEGMAVLAGSPEEIARYTRTLPRAARDGELRNLAALFDLADFPADKVTGFYCQSVSVTDYLVKLGGERNFKIFLGDVQRYGTAQALKRQYNIDGPQALEAAWKRTCLEPVR